MTVTPRPVLTLEITEPGGSPKNYAAFLPWLGSNKVMTISSNFGRQGDTAQIVLVDDYAATVTGFPDGSDIPHFAIKPLSTIVLTDVGCTSQPAQGVLFAGLVTNPQWSQVAPGLIEWSLQCVDFTYYANTAVVQGVFAGLTADEIVVELVNQANCGLKAKTVKNGGHVYPGPTIPLADIPYGQLSTALGTLTSLASQSQVYGWFVDPELNVWFYPTSLAMDSGITVTDDPTPTGDTYLPSYDECHLDGSLAYAMLYEWDATTFYTRVVVEGATATHSYDLSAAKKNTIPPTDSWVGNGSQRSWPLSYQPEVSASALNAELSTTAGTTSSGSASIPYLTVGGKAQKVSINDGTTTITTPYQFVQATNGLWTLQVTQGVGTTPAAGVVLKLWYTYQLPIIATANNLSQQRNAAGPNNGVFSDFISDTSITSSAGAFAEAKAVLTEYGAPQERLTFYTDESWLGWMRCGMTFTADLTQVPNSARSYDTGLQGTFFVNQQTVNFMPGGFRKTQVTSVRMT